MDPQQAQQVGYWVGVLFGGGCVGALCGILPLSLGRSRQRAGLATTGFVLCLLAGLVLGLLGAVPMMVVVSLIIVVLGPAARKPTKSSGKPYRNPIPDPVDF